MCKVQKATFVPWFVTLTLTLTLYGQGDTPKSGKRNKAKVTERDSGDASMPKDFSSSRG